MSNPKKYGYYLTEGDLLKPVQFECVRNNRKSTGANPYHCPGGDDLILKVIKDLIPIIKN